MSVNMSACIFVNVSVCKCIYMYIYVFMYKSPSEHKLTDTGVIE